MKPIIDHHHYRLDQIDFEGFSDRVAIYERYVVDLLLKSELDDNQRESSVAFELKHHHSTAHLARILARTRRLPLDVCTVGALLHDVYVVMCGKYKDHAHRSADIASAILNELGGFAAEEKEQILTIIYNHSDKDIWSSDPFVEFGKDVDTFDSFLYPNAFGYYLKHKKLFVFYNYVLRALKVWDELNIPQPRDFSIFDNFKDPWMDYKIKLSIDEAKRLLGLVFYLSDSKNNYEIIPPTILLHITDEIATFFVNAKSYNSFLAATTDFGFTDKDIKWSEIESAIEISRQSYLLIWCAINAYEIVDKETGLSRLSELGLSHF